MKKLILVALIYATHLPNNALALDTTEHKLPCVIPIKTAVESNMMQMRISGSYDPQFYHEIADKEGVHYGKCMDVIFKSKLDNTVLIKLECGTLLIPDDTSVQKMLVTKEVVFPLYPKGAYRTRFYAMCSQLHNHAPFILNTFKIGGLADTNLVKLAHYIDKTYNQNMLGQHAVWAYTDKVTFEDLKPYRADSNSITQTIAILDSAHIITPLNNNPVPEIILNHTITLNNYLVYGGLGLIAALSMATLVLAFRRNRKDTFTA